MVGCNPDTLYVTMYPPSTKHIPQTKGKESTGIDYTSLSTFPPAQLNQASPPSGWHDPIFILHLEKLVLAFFGHSSMATSIEKGYNHDPIQLEWYQPFLQTELSLCLPLLCYEASDPRAIRIHILSMHGFKDTTSLYNKLTLHIHFNHRHPINTTMPPNCNSVCNILNPTSPLYRTQLYSRRNRPHQRSLINLNPSSPHSLKLPQSMQSHPSP